MNLDEYLKAEGISMAEAARQLGVSRQWIQYICSREFPASRKTAEKIILWSGKKVTYEDLWPVGYQYPGLAGKRKPPGTHLKRGRPKGGGLAGRVERLERQLSKLTPIEEWDEN